MMKFAPRALGAALAALALTGAAAAEEYKWPRLLVIGTPGTSSGSFASTNGWAPILQKDVGTTVRVVPEDSETQRHRRLVDRKNIHVSSVSAAEMRSQIEGIGGYSIAKPLAQRVVWHHNDTPWGYVTAGDGDIKDIMDLKKDGIRVTLAMFSVPMQVAVKKALPAFLDIDPEKITFVPASSYAENCRSVVEGKSDVALCAPISSVLSEMEGAPGGIRWLSMDASQGEAWNRYLAHRRRVGRNDGRAPCGCSRRTRP